MTLVGLSEINLQLFLTVLSTSAVSAVAGAALAGIYALRLKRSEYINDFYKIVVNKRVIAYEQLEALIVELKTSVVGDDKRAYHLPFASEDGSGWESLHVLLNEVTSKGLWISDEAVEKIRALNYRLLRQSKPEDLIEFGKENYEAFATLRAALERILAKDMLRLYDVKSFLTTKNKEDSGFNLVQID